MPEAGRTARLHRTEPVESAVSDPDRPDPRDALARGIRDLRPLARRRPSHGDVGRVPPRAHRLLRRAAAGTLQRPRPVGRRTLRRAVDPGRAEAIPDHRGDAVTSRFDRALGVPPDDGGPSEEPSRLAPAWPMTGTERRRRTALLMAAIVLGPVLLDLLHGGTRAAFRYLAPDSFYYNTVARNIALHGRVSYDGLMPTNGFHPLWQITLAALYFVLHALRLPESAFLIGSVLLGAMLVAASVLILGHAMTASGRTLGAAALLGPVGLYAIVMLPAWLLLV